MRRDKIQSIHENEQWQGHKVGCLTLNMLNLLQKTR